MLLNEVLKIEIDDKTNFSFYFKSENIRIEDDGQVIFHGDGVDIDCGDGPLLYGCSSGIVDDMLAYIRWIFVSDPIDKDLIDRMGYCFYHNCSNRNINMKLARYIFTSSCDSIVWLYKINISKYYIEITSGSPYYPVTNFQKICSTSINEEKLKNWIVQLEKFKKLYTDQERSR